MIEWIFAGGAAGGILMTLITLGRMLLSFRGRVDAFLDDWNGESARPGNRGRPSMPERVSALEERLTAVERQVTPNGGNTATLADRVVRVERQVVESQGGKGK